MRKEVDMGQIFLYPSSAAFTLGIYRTPPYTELHPTVRGPSALPRGPLGLAVARTRYTPHDSRVIETRHKERAVGRRKAV